jgi:hypothetical protein
MIDMNRDDLKVVWICDDCKIVLVFHDDCEVHRQDTGHKHLTAYDIETGQMLANSRRIRYSGRSIYGNTV